MTPAQSRHTRQAAITVALCAALTAQAQTTPPRPPDVIDLANIICQRMRTGGATTCDIKANALSPSYIDVTLPTDAKDAQLSCLAVANWTRQPGSPFIGKGWTLKIYSPLGAGTRPIANCNL